MWDVHEMHCSPPYPNHNKQIHVLKKAEEKGARRKLDCWKEADWHVVRPVKYGADLSICSSPLCLLVCKIYNGGGGKKECSTCPRVCARLCVSLCLCGEAEWELGTAVLLSASGLSEKEFEVEGLRSPLRPHPCSQISCLTAHNCASLRLPESY